MYYLIFCDDDEEQARDISSRVLGYCRDKQGCEAKAVVCTRGEELFEALKASPEEKPIVFLGICMEDDEQGGIRLARKINVRYPNALVVYITGFLQYVSDVYETEHCCFILKEELEEKLPVLFEDILPAQLHRRPEWLKVLVSTKTHRIWQADIMYLERDLRKTRICLKGGETMETGEKLDALFPQLNPECFIRCHNSYIVNLNYVREMNRQFLVLSGGTVVNVSRSYANEVRRQFTRWGSRSF